MRRDNLVWGLALILFGVLFLLQKQGLISNVFEFFWPLVFILLGSWIVANVFWTPKAVAGETFTVPLSNAKHVRYRFNHGAAQIRIDGNAPAGTAMIGSSAVAGSYKSHSDGDRLEVKVETGPSFIPILGPGSGVWHYQVAKDVPITLTVEAGASQFDIDLKDTLASNLDLKVGACTVNVTMPAHGVCDLRIEGGAATFNVNVPEGVAARVNTAEGFVSLNVNEQRFPRSASGMYESANFDSAADRVLITVKAGVGSVNID
jgi:hypothetical protein